MSTVLVTGATGHLGSHLLPRLLSSGHQVRTFSRSTRTTMKPGLAAFTGDLTDGTGLADAVAGVDTVVHCASDPRHPASDATSTNNLLEALAKCGTDVHLVYISIVGVEAVPWNYYRAKHEAEQAVETAKLRWTIQRATQFHTFVDAMVGRLAQSPLMVIPRGFAFQPVATAEVADRLIEHVNHGPAGRAEDFGGPDILPASTIARSWLTAHGKRRAVLALPLPGQLSRAFKTGANLAPDGTRGHLTWQQYLDSAAPATAEVRRPDKGPDIGRDLPARLRPRGTRRGPDAGE